MVNDGMQFSDEIYKYNIGDTITLTLIRKRRFLKVDVSLKVFPINADKMYQTPKKSLLVPPPR
jgi:S1-C subfamily serine protease